MSEVLHYDTFEQKYSETTQKWRNTDDMNGANSYSPGSTVNFYMETGGNNFLVSPETYLSFTITFTATSDTVDTNSQQCTLDYNSAAIFNECWTAINGIEVERYKNVNMLINIIDTVRNGGEYNTNVIQYQTQVDTAATTSTTTAPTATSVVTITSMGNAQIGQDTMLSTSQFVLAAGGNAYVQGPSASIGYEVTGGIITVATTNTVPVTTSTTALTRAYDYQFRVYPTKHFNNWIGQSSDIPRQGRPFVESSVAQAAGAGTVTASYQLIHHVKSGFIGKCAKSKYFPLAFVTKLYYSAMLETALKAIKDTSFVLAGGGASLTQITWDYNISNVRINYTLSSPKGEVLQVIKQAYLKNALPDLLWSYRAWNWRPSDSMIPSGSTTGSSRFVFEAGVYDQLYFVLLRNGDFSKQEAASISSFYGGFKNVQCVINNNKSIPYNRIDTGMNAYEMYRNLISSNGFTTYNNTNIRLPSTFAPSTTVGDVGGNGGLISVNYYENSVNTAKNQPGAGICVPDYWNSQALLLVDYDNTNTNRTQGCTILSFALGDPLVGEMQDYGIELQEMAVELRWTFSSATLAPQQFYCFARQIKQLAIQGHNVEVRT